MPSTVKAKILLGWLPRYEALSFLKQCVFNEHKTKKELLGFWEMYRDRVSGLTPRDQCECIAIPMTEAENQAAEAHLARINATPKSCFKPEVIKVSAANILAKQFYVLADKSEEYKNNMSDEAQRANYCFGNGLNCTSPLVFRQADQRHWVVDLPHCEYVINKVAQGFNFQERDRHILAIRAPENRLVLWGGYHRTHAVLCHTPGEPDAVAPLLTVMTGIPEVDDFFSRPSVIRDKLLSKRPALLRDFLDENLFMFVNLRKTKAQGLIEMYRPGQFRACIRTVPDDD